MYETKKEALLMNKPLLSAREASNLIGCSISTLDKYEQERLLVPIMRVPKELLMSLNIALSNNTIILSLTICIIF